MRKTTVIFAAIVIALLAAAVFWNKERGTNGAITGTKDFKNAAYQIEGKNVVLKNGLSETEAVPGSASKIITRYFGNEAFGDLNNDGTEDAGFVLTQQEGGSGTFYYAVAALKTVAGYEGTNAVLLGDRIAPQTTEIRNGTLIVNYADRALSEPMTTQPSIGKSKYLVTAKSVLVETPIFIESPASGATVSSPLAVTGVAKGNWFFEASFPLVLTDEKGNIIAQKYATAQGDWMTPDYVRFSGTLEFNKPAGINNGILIFKKDNPSGLPEHDDSRSIEVEFE